MIGGMADRGDYYLGTDDGEVARLALQHRVWRPRALDAWRRAGFTAGQTIVDIGSGPGWASLDLADIVGPSGRVVALDRSSAFLASLEREQAARGVDAITAVELDLDGGAWPAMAADGAWARWILAFLREPRRLLAEAAHRLRPGARLVLHEYLDYRTWRLAPRSASFEAFVSHVIDGWRADGGEPDIGLQLPCWLDEAGFDQWERRVIVDVVSPADFTWQWPAAFLRGGLQRLVALGRLDPAEAAAIRDDFDARARTSGTAMVTPAVLEVIAIRR